jgi:cell division protein FtsN
MPRDYAKYRVIQPTAKKNRWSNGTILLSALLVVMLGGGFWLYQHKTQMTLANDANTGTFMSRLKMMLSHKKSASAKKPVSTVENNTPEEVHFEFYNELPNMHVPSETAEGASAPPPAPIVSTEKTADAPSQKAAAIKPDSQYFVQLGLYKDTNEASQTRLSLLLNGLESQVVKVTENGETSYRLQQGPYTTLSEAKAAQKKLQRKGVESVIKSPS